ncbi:MAG TPA: ABC transporter substrate-binding protein [Acidimicrobiales bacterium]|nr:ABC transporter substrate-binding protein [Acidimicrobiales bacterium]
MALTAGCGSTVRQRGALSTDEGLSPTTAPAVDGGLGETPDGPAASAAGSPGARASATRTGGTTRAASAAVKGSIELGFITTAVSNAGALGFATGQSFTDRQVFDAVVAEYNARGGMAGRKIVPIFANTDTAATSWDSQFQAACAQFTQDNKVQAVLGYVFVFLDNFEQCLARASVAHFYGGYQPGDGRAQKDFPTLVSTAHPTVDIADLTVFKGAVQSRLLTPATKLGVLIDNCAHGRRAFDASAAYLKAQHIDYELVEMSCASGSGDVTSASATISNAELRFATRGVDVVAAGGVALLVFMAAAESQGYHPTYLTSAGGAALEPNAPSAQLAKLHGFGWLPAVDVNQGHQPGPRSAAQQACLGMLQKHGLTPTGYNDFMIAYTTCDSMALYEQALIRTGGRSAATDVVPAALASMPTFLGAAPYGGRLTSTVSQRGGAAQWREWGWAGDCSCFTYRGSAYPIPSL